MTLNDILVLVDYHYWARDRVLDAVEPLTSDRLTRELGSSFPTIRATLVHIYFAEWIWHLRWLGQTPAAPLQPEMFPDVATLREAWREHEAKVRSFVEGLGEDGVGRICHYRSLNGQPAASTFAQMIQHVVNHGTYHRGQVTTMLRQIGAPPPKSTDFIAFCRERAL